MVQIMERISDVLLKKTQVYSIADNHIAAAMKKFEEYSQKGTIIGSWGNNTWEFVSKEGLKHSACFGTHEEELRNHCEETGYRYDCLIEQLKTTTALQLGMIDLRMLASSITYILGELEKSKIGTKMEKPNQAGNPVRITKYVEFLKIIGVRKEYISMCMNVLIGMRTREAERRSIEGRKPTELAEFQSYFRFDRIIREVWSNMSIEEKKYYYPLYLFWMITNIIPLRVTEFLVTSFRCLSVLNDKYYMTVRRSRLKGHSSIDSPKVHKYTIDGDYTEHVFEITKDVYDAVDAYRELTKGQKRYMDTLIVSNSTKQQTGNSTEPNHICTSKELSDLIKSFYRDIICECYGYKIVGAEDLSFRLVEGGSYELYDNEIMVISAKHTRHLAMINLITRGVNPMTIKEFAGHADDEMSAHYYGNVTNMVRCAVKDYFDRVRRKCSVPDHSDGNVLALISDWSGRSMEVDGGLCHNADAIMLKDVSVCVKFGGDCSICDCFENISGDRQTRVKTTDEIDQEVLYLRSMLMDPNIDGKIEEYQQKALEIQHDFFAYARHVWEEEKQKWADRESTSQVS